MKDKLDICLSFSVSNLVPSLGKNRRKIKRSFFHQIKNGKMARLGLLAACLFLGMGVGFHFILPRGPFLQSPGNFSGRKHTFKSKYKE